MKKIFIICPVRNATVAVKRFLQEYIEKLEREGSIVHYPPRDTNQSDPVGDAICRTNFRAIVEADEIHVWYDLKSLGSHFDLGGVFMLVEILEYEKKVVVINADELQFDGKSFSKVLRFLAEREGVNHD